MITQYSSPREKITLFRSLFRGREDVYARRFESKRTGRSGYSPCCANEWLRGVCEKPRIRCTKCPNRQLMPVTDKVIRNHLTGRDAGGLPVVVGVYPMLLDETCFFLAIDLDGNNWQDDASALTKACRTLALPAALERSRSGNGGHLWFFFEEAVPATLARKMGAHLLTEAMEQRPELGFLSYDRMFPNQDTLPKGGFGNLIALPLQGTVRDAGNSVFLDDNIQPQPDQWRFLSTVPRLTTTKVREIVARASTEGRIVGVPAVPEDEDGRTPWTLAPSGAKRRHLPGKLPASITGALSDQLYLPKADLPAPLRNGLLRIAAFQNPEFYRAQAMRLPTYDKPSVIACAEDYPDHIALPRGCLGEVRKMLRSNSVRFSLKDKRAKGTPLAVTFSGALRDDQQEAMASLLAHDIGVIAATTAFGKTVLAAALIAARRVNALVLVHRRQLMDQWVERLTSFLDVEDKEIGRLGGGRRKLKGRIDIALLQSVVRKGVVDARVADYGHVIVDECHHVSARSFELAVRRAKAKYVLGLSATVTRKDGHHPIIFMQCGPIRYEVGAKQHAATRELAKQAIVRPTCHEPEECAGDDNRREDFVRLMDNLIHDTRRNAAICDDVQAAIDAGALPMVLTERTEHLELLAAGLHSRGLEVVRLRGGLSKAELRDAQRTLMRLEAGLAREEDQTQNAACPHRPPEGDGGAARGIAIVATGRFVGEGFDAPQLDSLFLAMPVSWRGTVAQYVGRLHRTHEGKSRVRVFDYADLNVPVLSRMFDRRCKAYRKQGYAILLPASAIPGWPREVPLPIEESWKQTYSASVQRLVRDGVDVPLAELFVEVTEMASVGEQEGEDRARSASEAFLLRRLESLPEIKGRFTLNARLPITFRSRGNMEVDFLDSASRIVIELDGSRHFDNLDAYRRDREKDYLLQEHGYFVLRFLAEDLGPHLNDILDTILRALAHRQSKGVVRKGTPNIQHGVTNTHSASFVGAI